MDQIIACRPQHVCTHCLHLPNPHNVPVTAPHGRHDYSSGQRGAWGGSLRGDREQLVLWWSGSSGQSLLPSLTF